MSEKVKRVMDPADYGQEVGELPKVGGRNGIKVFLRECDGHLFIELRKWKEVKHYSGPDKQGITLQPDQVDTLAALIDQARQELERGKAGQNEDISADIP